MPDDHAFDPHFDTLIDRRGTHCAKWDGMESAYGVSPDDGLAMWVADMDFASADPIQAAVQRMADHGVFGYFTDDSAYRAAICWWMENRHGWSIDPAAILTTHGLCNAVGLCVDVWSDPGDAVILFTPVYHAFARVIAAAGRQVTECPLVQEDGQYVMDFDAYESLLTGREKMLILCSPHNPGGRVWTRDELRQVAAFAEKHDLLVISDEIHHDLVFPGAEHVAFPLAAPGLQARTVMLTAASKTFNTAGAETGNVIIADPKLRADFQARQKALSLSPNAFGLHMITAAYSPEGAAWVDALVPYIDENRRIFDAGVNAIPGLVSMPMQATYLSWVDFSGTGMSRAEFTDRVYKQARIAANQGTTFGTGGESFLRFNIGTQRARVVEAVERLQAAFADLQ
ncbi:MULTISPECIES: MalY/PatB family protein [unclassified Meridianimarinicoccus]|uniref:MalY/PatB family protein n=1 Tax=unclassified Meridianimarinicoccus TaxID=2923344 RepID=UPI001866D3E3|nr:MalY/PatB family protein [Fluviibacterium sp. MJW13]